MLTRVNAPALLLAIAALALLTFGGPSQRAHADSDDIIERGVADLPPEDGDTAIVVKYHAGVTAQARDALEAGHGLAEIARYPRSGLNVLGLAPGADVEQTLAALLADPAVEAASEQQTVHLLDFPNDPSYDLQWHLHDTEAGVRADLAWDLAPSRGAGVVVAVIDTGLAYETHTNPAEGFYPPQQFAPAPDLAGVPIVAPWDFVDGDSHANDDHGHGTHVASTIAQATDNGLGGAGVAPNATLMPIKVLDENGAGDTAALVDALYYAVDNGADVINLSLGFSDPNGNCSSVIGLAEALEYAHSSGVVVVAAAGNEGASTVSCPAAYPTVIAVGATRFDSQLPYYSNTGAALDIVAPGGDPTVDQNLDGYTDGVLQQTFCSPSIILRLTGNYGQFCEVFNAGTSMASPHVAGVAALLLGESPSLSPEAVRGYLETTARDAGAPGWDAQFGWGQADAAAALGALTGTPVDPPPPAPLPEPPAAPSDLTATATSATTIALTWTDNSDDEQYFRVERSTDGTTFTQVALLVADRTSWTDYLGQASTTYHYRVRASAGSLYSDYSAPAQATTPGPPAAPSDLSATAASASSITLSWTDNSDDEQYFRIERSTDGASFTQIAVVLKNVTVWTNSNLAPETTYHYRVRASAGSVYSDYTNAASATTASAPAAPSDLVAETASPSSIALSWTDNADDEQYYRVERSTNGVTFIQVAVLLANTTSWTNNNLTADTTYSYRVRASAGTAYSEYSSVAEASTGSPPAAPSDLVAESASASSIALSWTDNADDEQYYRVERSSDGVTFAQVAVVLANSTTWTNNNLAADTTYHYRVRASTGAVYSDYSNVATATTDSPPAAPSDLVAETASPSSIDLTWTDNSDDEQYFRIERSTDGVSFTQVAVVLANRTSYTNSNLASDTTYHYRVRVSAGAVYSDYSNVAEATTDAPPAAPSDLTVTALSSSSARLTWTDNADGEQYYRIERSTDGVNFTQVAIVLANYTAYTNYGLSAGETYHYRVRASAGPVYSDYSEVVSLTIE